MIPQAEVGKVYEITKTGYGNFEGEVLELFAETFVKVRITKRFARFVPVNAWNEREFGVGAVVCFSRAGAEMKEITDVSK